LDDQVARLLNKRSLGRRGIVPETRNQLGGLDLALDLGTLGTLAHRSCAASIGGEARPQSSAFVALLARRLLRRVLHSAFLNVAHHGLDLLPTRCP
jgi:hypothetical protein